MSRQRQRHERETTESQQTPKSEGEEGWTVQCAPRRCCQSARASPRKHAFSACSCSMHEDGGGGYRSSIWPGLTARTSMQSNMLVSTFSPPPPPPPSTSTDHRQQQLLRSAQRLPLQSVANSIQVRAPPRGALPPPPPPPPRALGSRAAGWKTAACHGGYPSNDPSALTSSPSPGILTHGALEPAARPPSLSPPVFRRATPPRRTDWLAGTRLLRCGWLARHTRKCAEPSTRPLANPGAGGAWLVRIRVGKKMTPPNAANFL
ncbi:hypothetical protein AOLI_G00321730 [Acnodon oligacanthus]